MGVKHDSLSVSRTLYASLRQSVALAETKRLPAYTHSLSPLSTEYGRDVRVRRPKQRIVMLAPEAVSKRLLPRVSDYLPAIDDAYRTSIRAGVPSRAKQGGLHGFDRSR